MELLGDVWVNWCFEERKSYGVLEFHEWRNKIDHVELIAQTPLLLIETELFRYIENNLNPLPIKMLELIENTSFIRMNNRKESMRFACALTDGNSVLVVDTIGTQIPKKKSRMIIRQEQMVINKVKKGELKLIKFDFNPIVKKEIKYLDIPNEYMIGLTRRERAFKELLFYIYRDLENENNIHKIRYYYSEWNPNDMGHINKLNYRQVFHRLFEESKNGWNAAHDHLLQMLIRTNLKYKEMYDDEMAYVM